MKFLITGGYGFIGSAVIRYILGNTEHNIINVDNLTYASNLNSLKDVENNPKYHFYKSDICNKEKIKEILDTQKPDYIMHLAAESHVDNSINDPSLFIETNIMGTYSLLECTCKYWQKLQDKKKETFRFHHISTDEVYGDLSLTDEPFSEVSPYRPSSPYSASKASSDHLVQAWNRTYKLPTIITNCSNNYGPFQNQEKLIPTVVSCIMKGLNIPIYGDGKQIRDWLYVEDHAIALFKVVTSSKSNTTYNIGGENQVSNIELVLIICQIFEKLNFTKTKNIKKFTDLIKYVDDRPGHDRRYAINSQKIKSELSWTPQNNFLEGIEKTILWYIENRNL